MVNISSAILMDFAIFNVADSYLTVGRVAQRYISGKRKMEVIIKENRLDRLAGDCHVVRPMKQSKGWNSLG